VLSGFLTPVRGAPTIPAVVELIFMMLILKLPILYLVGVCIWAIRAEPKPLEGARVTARLDEQGPWTPFRRHPRKPTSHGGPRRREARTARARVRPSH
jgi:hypothetical protein